MDIKGPLFRYLILVVVGFNLYLLYDFFTPLTVYPSAWILDLFGEVIVQGSLILFNDLLIDIIPACVAGSAYYFLLGLNLTTPMKTEIRLKSLLFLFSTFLGFNLLRIVLFVGLASVGFQYFDVAHRLTWNFGSTLLVVILWFVNIKLFGIKKVPVLSDFRPLLKIAKSKQKG